ncbi:ParB/RepB/Spo0J family partition protein [Panacibacter ginsenosidivorans]|uniref:ParB/RepB/Spo0J family partition protein n=1 Tax=Panacibacter ginsenosidivorans TaxID=1813871 RepID=A0A5B8V7I1_9BACT|nr:ParB/RepB/Spo0J family partition protein [Panacibacter ginsenosidivorans]QEC67384.1 ParB/RepB/Spo0J family partition protein [Panacibacter ginsenosidivorans]
MTTPKQNKDLLGKGIRSLLQNIDTDLKTTTGNLKSTVVETATASSRIALEQIQTNPRNPRHDFDETALNELAASIKLHDIIQPVTVSKLASGKYQLIAGERRFRAAKMAGLKDIPAYIRQANDAELLELALLENLQREDLNAIEIGLSYKRMMEELNHTQEQVAERMGKERSTVTNYIRLLKLPPDIQLAVRSGNLSMGHARALINIDTIDKQLFVYAEIKNKGLSVRQTEELVRNLYKNEKPGAVKSSSKSSLPPAYKRIEDNLASHFGTKVKLNHNNKGYGSITLEYYSLEELNKILEQMSIQVS